MAASSRQTAPSSPELFNTLTLCRVPDTRERLWARVRQGSRLEDRFIGPANLFLTLASPVAPKFQSLGAPTQERVEKRREHSREGYSMRRGR
jgi:hypothetical protein